MTVIYGILLAISLVAVYPVVYAVSASFSDPALVLNGKLWLLPKGFHTQAYVKVLQYDQIWRSYWNTIRYTVTGVSVNLVMTVLAAYPLSKRNLAGRNLIMGIIVFTMFFQGGLIPSYMLAKSLGLPNTMWALVFPVAVSTYNMIIMRTFFMNSIPNELYEAARVDGSSHTRVLVSIVLPLSKPVLSVMLLYYSAQHWNSYFPALIYLSDARLQPLQIVLREILLQSSTDSMTSAGAGATERLLQSESIKYAMIIIGSAPMLILYPFIQKYFAQGVMIGAVKG